METRHVVLTEPVRNLEKQKDEIKKRVNDETLSEFIGITTAKATRTSHQNTSSHYLGQNGCFKSFRIYNEN